MKNKLKSIFVSLLLWITVTLVTIKNELSHDVFLEVGYPYIFYKDFNGKANYSDLSLGFNFTNLFLDLVIFYLIFILFIFLFKKINKTK